MKVKILQFRFLILTIFLISFFISTSAQYYDNSEMKISTTLGISSYSEGIQPVQKYFTQYGNCYAFAPANWEITGCRREGDALDICSADRNMCAGYLILGVQGSLATGYYSQIYATPETYLSYIISENGEKAVSYGEPVRDVYGYTMLPFEIEGSPAVTGVVFYKVWAVSGDPYGYIIAIRIAKTVKQFWRSKGAQVVSVCLSIRSVVQFQSSGSNNPESFEDKEVESGYNMQLGMEYVHDPDTGENYWVSPSKDFNETGPDGPGYYKHIGNDTKKLLPGRSDD
ncbi:MAG: hypothetical protein PHD61_04810 [Bacteroidales bacterium]|nr:hypothetical protein [Lentimicrobiaceae bacterium]MDD5694605.1 hypothetical protein [Bacteroidales bacterium]